MKYLLCILMGYAVGTVNPSYIIAKIKGFDIREKGSGNAGASNALIIFGKLVGVLCALFDIAKAALIIILAQKLFPELVYAFAVTGVSCVLGHVFPFYMKFKGGKGLACLGGMILAFNPFVFIIMLACEIAVVLITNYICFVPVTASVVFPIVYGIMRHDLVGALILCILIPVILFRHRENFSRIKNGTELRISFLWSKDKELKRLNIDDKNQ